MSIIRKGADKVYKEGGKSSIFMTLKDGDSVSVALLGGTDEILSVDMHSWWDVTPAPHLVCLGSKAECPSCQLGHESKVKSYIPIVTQEGEPKLLIAGAQIINALKELEIEVKNLKGVVVRIKRNGKGLSTRYVTMGTGKKVKVDGFEVPELEPALGPLTYEGQVEVMGKVMDVSALKGPGKSVAPATKKEIPFDVDDETSAEESTDDGTWAAF